MSVDYTIPSDVFIPSVRFWPKYHCEKLNGEDGQNCAIGESGKRVDGCKAQGCPPKIDSAFQVTINNKDGKDIYETNVIDGWTLPFDMEFICGNETTKVDC